MHLLEENGFRSKAPKHQRKSVYINIEYGTIFRQQALMMNNNLVDLQRGPQIRSDVHHHCLLWLQVK
jgi:hypothetical protein